MSTMGDRTFSGLLAEIAAKSPTPGGGAVVGATGAIAAALGGMVVSYSLGKKSLAAHQPELERASEALARARAVFVELADEDASAYGLVNELMRLPEGDARRARELPGVLRASIQVPLAVIAAAADLLRMFQSLVPITNKQLHSDLGIAVTLAAATARASLWNVRVNAAMLTDEAERRRCLEQAEALARDAGERAAPLERSLGGT